MRVREVHFSTSLREIDLARWCCNHLAAYGEERFYLRWDPATGDYAIPVHSWQELKAIRGNDRVRIVRLASRILSLAPLSRPPLRPGPPPPTARPSVPSLLHLGPVSVPGAQGIGSPLPIHFATANTPPTSPG
jgi:hypothetical protein